MVVQCFRIVFHSFDNSISLYIDIILSMLSFSKLRILDNKSSSICSTSLFYRTRNQWLHIILIKYIVYFLKGLQLDWWICKIKNLTNIHSNNDELGHSLFFSLVIVWLDNWAVFLDSSDTLRYRYPFCLIHK